MPMFALVSILNSVISLLMATLISGLFSSDIFIEFYATLSASLLGITLAQFGLGNVMLSFRDEISGRTDTLITTWSLIVIPPLVIIYLLILGVYLKANDTHNIDLLAVGIYIFGRSCWLSFQASELILHSFQSVVFGLIIQILASCTLVCLMYYYDTSVKLYFIVIGLTSVILQIAINRGKPDLSILKLEYLVFAFQGVLNSVLITFFAIGDKLFANSLLVEDKSILSDYFNASIVIGYFNFIVNIYSNWWGSLVSKNWSQNKIKWRDRKYFVRNVLWFLLIIPMLLGLFAYKLFFDIWNDTIYFTAGFILSLNLVAQAMMKFTQGIILMEKDMRALIISSLIGFICFIVLVLFLRYSPSLRLSIALCISSFIMLFFHTYKVKNYDF